MLPILPKLAVRCSRFPIRFVSVAFLAVGLLTSHTANAQATIYSFTGANGDGAFPYGLAGLIMDASGNLYGTTEGGGANGLGAVFELVNNNGTYAETTLHSFTDANGDGGYPDAGLIMDQNGNLYGTTIDPGQGTVFELVKNNDGTYTEKTLHSFTGANGDGAYPQAGLIMDQNGDLFGTTFLGGDSDYCLVFGGGCGTVFELVNSNGSFSFTVLHSFTGQNGDGAYPWAGVILDSNGNLYGEAGPGDSGGGIVFELVNSNGSYSENVLYTFAGANGDGDSPTGGVVMDGKGALYGTTNSGGTSTNCPGGCGTVFKLVNTNGSYIETVLHSFTGATGDGANPLAGPVLDANGDLYGTTTQGGSSSGNCPYGCGAVFELVNSNGSYTATLLHSFTGANGDGVYPGAGVVLDRNDNLFGTTQGGGASGGNCPSGCGTAFEIPATPQARIQSIIEQVNLLLSQGALNSGQDNSLISELQHAINMINAGKINGAIGNLESFITEVNDLSSSGVLSPAQAGALVSGAMSVIQQLQSM